MNEVDVIVELKPAPKEASFLEAFALTVLERLGVKNWAMGVMLTDDRGIREYSRRWRGVDAATDVLSFVMSEGESPPRVPGTPFDAGDVVISLQRTAEQAGQRGETFETELRRVLIHGILHLRGMDHPGDDYGGGMLRLQEELVGSTGPLKGCSNGFGGPGAREPAGDTGPPAGCSNGFGGPGAREPAGEADVED